MGDRIQLRRGTTEEWVFANPILQAGEPGFETSTQKVKLGNGVDRWSELLYLEADAGSVSWSEVYGKPSVFPPSSHASSHASNGSDALSPSDIGAAPAASPTFTGVITVSATSGSAGSYLPSVTFENDPNTGFGTVGADKASVFAAGEEMARVGNAGLQVRMSSGGTQYTRVSWHDSAGAVAAAGVLYKDSYSSVSVVGVGAGGYALYTASSNIGLATLGNDDVIIGTGNAERLRVKSTGAVNFTPRASDPASGVAGDVYYNSSTNKLRVHTGTSWTDLH